MIVVVVMEDAMGKLLVPDELWQRVEPILPKHPPSPKGGKPRTPDRVCLGGILFVLKTGIPWEDFPQEMGCCGMSGSLLRHWRGRYCNTICVPSLIGLLCRRTGRKTTASPP